MVVAAALTSVGGKAEAAPYTAWQEIVMLTVIKVRDAGTACGFRENTGKVAPLLASAALTEADLGADSAMSDSLSRQVRADQDAYRGDRDSACAEAWARFGTDGPPGLRDLLVR